MVHGPSTYQDVLHINNKHCKVLFDTFTSQTVTTDIQMVNVSFNNIYSENLLKLCKEIFKVWKTEEVVLPIDAPHNSVTFKGIKTFMGTLETLIQTYRLPTAKLMIMYQTDQAKIINLSRFELCQVFPAL